MQEGRIAAERRVREQLGLPMMSSNPTGCVSDDTLQVEREIIGAQAYAFGEVWSRPGLDIRTRCFITLAVLTAKYQLGPPRRLRPRLHQSRHCARGYS
jgi:4-carboxymuconolactone decarboxylase